MANAVELTNITKIFPGVVADDDVSLFVEQGDIHGLIGELKRPLRRRRIEGLGLGVLAAGTTFVVLLGRHRSDAE